MTLKPLKPPRPLRPFRSFLPDRFRGKRQGQRLAGKLNEETLQGTIKGGSAIVIGHKATDDERAEAIDGFVEDIVNMEGEKIFALAVAFD
jgi:hypothetical protein